VSDDKAPDCEAFYVNPEKYPDDEDVQDYTQGRLDPTGHFDVN